MFWKKALEAILCTFFAPPLTRRQSYKINFGPRKAKLVDINQACSTYGLQAKCGPRKLLIWPAQLNFVFFPSLFNINTLSRRKNISFLALDYCKKKFLIRLRFELCTPDIAIAIQQIMVTEASLSSLWSKIDKNVL